MNVTHWFLVDLLVVNGLRLLSGVIIFLGSLLIIKEMMLPLICLTVRVHRGRNKWGWQIELYREGVSIKTNYGGVESALFFQFKYKLRWNP